MLKKRIVFTLLYANSSFHQSRNFRLQSVGGLNWLKENYQFSRVARFIDELVILNVDRNFKNIDKFSETVKDIAGDCFVPIAAGGGIDTVADAKKLLMSGADKIVANSALLENPQFIESLIKEIGAQSLVGSVDVRRSLQNDYAVYTQNGSKRIGKPLTTVFAELRELDIGDLYITSIDRDGTGQGYDFDILRLLPSDMKTPVIFAGGVGNARHMLEGLRHNSINGVATANLLNFVGEGLRLSRQFLENNGCTLAQWPIPAAQDI